MNGLKKALAGHSVAATTAPQTGRLRMKTTTGDQRDVELPLAALREQRLANQVFVLRDGE